MRAARGFTLLEVMVSMALFTLLVATAYSGLRIGARTVEATDLRAGDAQSLATVSRVLEQYLSSAQPILRRRDASDGRRSLVEFEGSAERVEFVAEMPSRLGYGGLYRIALSFADGDESASFEFERTLLGLSERGLQDPAAATRRTLLAGIEGGRFEYFGAERRRDRPQWQAEWSEQRLPPLAVRVVFDDPARALPTLVFPLRLQVVRSVDFDEEEDILDTDDEGIEPQDARTARRERAARDRELREQEQQ